MISMQYTMGPVTSHPLTPFRTIIAHSVEKLSTIESYVPLQDPNHPTFLMSTHGPQLQTMSFCTYT